MRTNNVDFTICPFIESQMWIVTYDDFVGRRFGIKRLYNDLDKNAKIFYKWYVYCNVHMNETYKNAIWNYLNNDEVFYESELKRLQKSYRAR